MRERISETEAFKQFICFLFLLLSFYYILWHGVQCPLGCADWKSLSGNSEKMDLLFVWSRNVLNRWETRFHYLSICTGKKYTITVSKENPALLHEKSISMPKIIQNRCKNNVLRFRPLSLRRAVIFLWNSKGKLPSFHHSLLVFLLITISMKRLPIGTP